MKGKSAANMRLHQGDTVEHAREIGPEPMPAELDRWNWGAFGLTWIWGIANRTPAAWLVFVPVAGWIGMPFVLGLKGNAWAWRNRRWPDVATFQRTQRSWAWRALIAWTGAVMGACIIGALTVSMFKSSEAYQLAQTELSSDPQLIERFGTPIELGTPSGSLKAGTGSGGAQLAFSIHGPKAQGKAYVNAVKDLGRWQLQSVAVELADGTRLEKGPPPSVSADTPILPNQAPR